MKFVLSVGGSIINPGSIDLNFLKGFKRIVKESKNDFIIVCGGGIIARNYIAALNKLSSADESSKDLMGISATWVNAKLLNLMFGDLSPSRMPDSFEQVISQSKNNKVVTCGGFFPGITTDEDAAILAELVKADYLINLTNTDYVYDKDPEKHDSAKPFKKLTYEKYLKIAKSTGISAGRNAPFSLYAAMICQRSNIKIIVASKDLKNLKKIFSKKGFKGTIIK